APLPGSSSMSRGSTSARWETTPGQLALVLALGLFAPIAVAQDTADATPAQSEPPSKEAPASNAPTTLDDTTAEALARLKLAERLMTVSPPRIAKSSHYMMMTDIKEPEVPQPVLNLVERCRARFLEYF